MSEEFECDECGKTFDTKRGLKVHASQVHKDEDDSSKAKSEGKKSTEMDTTTDMEFEVSPWKLVSGILAVLLAVTLVFAVRGMPVETGEAEGEAIPREEAENIAMDFFNDHMKEQMLGPEAEDLEAEEVNEEYGLYEVVVLIEGMMGPQEHSLYITQDGEIFFPEAVDIEEFEQMMEEQEQMIEDMEGDEGGEEEIVIEPE